MSTDDARWVRVMDLDDLWEGEIAEVIVDGEELILIHLAGGHVSAFVAACPHQGTSLADADLEDEKIVCPAHLWEFDARSGAGVNPSSARLVARGVRVHDDAIWIERTRTQSPAGAPATERER